MKRFVLASILMGACAVGCTMVSSNFCDYVTCVDSVDGGDASVDSATDGSVDAKADRDPPPPGCETPNEPLKNPEKCLVDSFGVFVSAGGSDTNDGTKAKPFKTIGKGLLAGKDRIVVCEGTYAESLDIKGDVEIYSGVTCDFARAGGKAKIAPEASTGLTVENGVVGLYDVEVTAKAATTPGASSIGILAKSGAKLTLRRSTVAAAAGADGNDAAATGNNHVASVEGNPASGSTGAGAKVCACPMFGASEGGAGGAGGNAAIPAGKNGAPGAANPAPATTGGATGAGGNGAPDGISSCSNGVPGSPGAARQGGKVSSAAGAASASGWTPSTGGAGEAGNPAQGGGGGGGSFYAAMMSSGGGGGGCGGCGGAGAPGGGSGGASIGILAVDAQVDIGGTTISTAKGGAGKAGGTGQAGGGGGGGGTVGACAGARGGAGAGGGGGAGGHGGPSVGIAYTGDAPMIDGKAVADGASAAGVQVGEPGAGGGGGEGGAAVVGAIPAGVAGNRGADGSLGVAKAVTKVEKAQ